jgi:hypothetical protein
MPERRISTRQKSFLQGRVYYNNRRSTADCLVRDISDSGARLVFSGPVALPEVMEIYLSNKQEVRRAKIQWQRGSEIGVDFGFDDPVDLAAMAASTDLFGRLLKLEGECASLKRVVTDMRAEMRKLRSETV